MTFFNTNTLGPYALGAALGLGSLAGLEGCASQGGLPSGSVLSSYDARPGLMFRDTFLAPDPSDNSCVRTGLSGVRQLDNRLRLRLRGVGFTSVDLQVAKPRLREICSLAESACLNGAFLNIDRLDASLQTRSFSLTEEDRAYAAEIAHMMCSSR